MPRIKMNEEAIADIKELRRNGASIKDIAAKYSITTSRVYQLTEGVEKPKRAERINGKCQWCGTRVQNYGMICSNCSYRLKLIRKIRAIGQVIRKCAEEERMQRDGC